MMAPTRPRSGCAGSVRRRHHPRQRRPGAARRDIVLSSSHLSHFSPQQYSTNEIRPSLLPINTEPQAACQSHSCDAFRFTLHSYPPANVLPHNGGWEMFPPTLTRCWSIGLGRRLTGRSSEPYDPYIPSGSKPSGSTPAAQPQGAQSKKVGR